jgi:hypothetical protein
MPRTDIIDAVDRLAIEQRRTSAAKPEAEGAGGFDARLPDGFVDLLLDPPAEWDVVPPEPPPPPEPTEAELARARTSRLRSLARQPWTGAEPYRVHFYDPKKVGTWLHYFADRAEAEAFAVGKKLWHQPALVETKRGFKAR